MSAASKAGCPDWCVLDEHPADEVDEGWAWHRGETRQASNSDGAVSVWLECTTGLAEAHGEADVAPYVTISGPHPDDVDTVSDVAVRDVDSLIEALTELRAAVGREAA